MRGAISLLPEYVFRALCSVKHKNFTFYIFAFIMDNTKAHPKVAGLSHNEIYIYNDEHWLRSNIKGYGGKTHYTDSQNSDKTTPTGGSIYHLQFSLQVASPETFGYTLLRPVRW
jgi:hypothetical protein